LSGQAEQLQQAVAFFNRGQGNASAAKGRPDTLNGTDRRAPNSPMRTLNKAEPAAPKMAATGTHGNFRPY